MAVTRRGVMSRFGRSLFGDRPGSIGHDPFDKDHRVEAEDVHQARALLGADLVAEHVASRVPEWSLQGTELLTYRTGRIGDPASIPDQFQPLLRVADLIDAG